MSSRSKSPAPMGTSGPNRYHHTVTSLQASGHHIPRSVSASYFPASPHSQMARPRSLYSLSQNNYVGSPNYSNPNRASSYMPASDYDDSIEPMVHAGHKRSASSHHLRSSSSSGALTTAVTSSASFTASAQPDRYHRRRSLANAPTTASYSNISTFQDSNSDQVMPPSPIVTPVNTSSNSLYTTNAISSSSSLSLLASSQQPQQPPQSLPSQQLQQQQHIHQETIYKNPGHSQSTSAISSASSGSKKDYSSLSSVSSYSSEVPNKSYKSSTAAPSASNFVESVKKPTLEPIQTNVPSAQPHPTQQRQSSAQLVLPSDVRRSSMVAPSAPFSRSSNSSSSPTTVDSPTSILKPPRKRESYIESGKFAYTPQQQQSKRPSKLPLSPSPSSSLSGPIINSTFTRSSMLPPPRSASVPPLQQNRANTIAPISKPTTALDKPQEMPIQSQPNPANNPESSKSLGSRLKKAFTFNSKSSKKSSSSKVAVTNLKSSTMPATNEFGRGGDMDTRSLFSVRSTASTSSFATLRRVGGRLSKGTQSLFRHQRTDNDDAFSPNVISDFAGNANSPSTGSTAIPVVTHAVAEAEILSISPAISSNTLKQTNTTGATVDDNISELNPPTDAANIDDSLFLSGLSSTTGIDTDLDGSDIDDSNSIQKETPVGIAELEVNDTEAIPSLTSSAESSTNDSEEIDEEEELAAADTVFPKKLDLLTVENIRSSLERTKSLERRRSRRSTHSGNEKERTQETVPNATEIHVVNTELQPAISVAGEPSKSILKSSSASTISLGDESTLDGKSFHSIESPNDTLDSKIGSSNLNIDFGETSLDLNFEFGQTPVNISLLQDTSKGEKVEASSSQYPDQEPLEGAKTRVRTNSDDSIHSEISTEQHRQFHYHPLYRHRMSEYHTRSSSYGSIGSDSQSVDQRGHYKSESAEIANTVSFSSRIVVFDTYGATDYDRHPELATCNRLTPLLAQQIKEELNTFKMEMDIHRDSRVYTHFF